MDAAPTPLQPVPEAFNATDRDFPRDRTVHGWFELQAAATPDRPAVKCAGEELTYAQLERASRRLADSLRSRGVRPGDLVGVHVERSLAMVVSVLAVLRTGAAYVPLDPAFPAERLGVMIEDAGIAVILTQSAHAALLPPHRAALVRVDDDSGPSGEGAGMPIPAAVPDSLPRAAEPADPIAYVIFTSGSTGRPKGVRVPHRSLVNFLNSMRREPGLGAGDVLLSVTTLSFDIAGLELFLPLVVGATVVVAKRETIADGERLRRELEESKATLMQATPVTWRMLLEAGWRGSPGLKILIGGEAVPRDLVNALAPRCASFWNMYGPTETTIWSTTGRLVAGEGVVSIGRPIDNTRVHVVDAVLRPVAVGQVGELLIGGEGVAAGYLNRPELTAERFVPDVFRPSTSARLFRTGDLARWREDGTLECLGRSDDQVKVRGFRIEVGDVEAALRAEAGVRAAAVAAREAGPGDLRLVAYLVPEPAAPAPDLPAIRGRLRERLPEYMVPTAWRVVERLPLTPNGKLDRRALPPLQGGHGVASAPFRPPRTPEESRMAGLWCELLKVEKVGLDDDFFDLGGHSLLAVQLFARIEREFGRRLVLASLFRHPTPAALLRLLAAEPAAGAGWTSIVPIQEGRRRPPFFCVHGAGGNVLLYRDLVRALGSEVTFYGLQSLGVDGRAVPRGTVEEMAAAYVGELTRAQPEGPYLLGGYCMGGTVAYEMARQLSARGDRVALLALLDTYNFAERIAAETWSGRLARVWEKAIFHGRNILEARGARRIDYLRAKVRQVLQTRRDRRSSLRPPGAAGDETTDVVSEKLRSLEAVNHAAGMNYRPGPSAVKLTVFMPRRRYSCYPDAHMGWRSLARGGLEIVELPLNPHAMLVTPYVDTLAAALRERLELAWADTEAEARTHRATPAAAAAAG